MRGHMKGLGYTFNEVILAFDRARTGRMDNIADRFYYDVLYDMYRITVTNDSRLHDAYGNFDVDRFIRLQTDFRKRHGEGAWRYIEDRRKDGRHLPGAVKELNDARAKLTDYWELHKTLWAKDSWQVELIDNWRSIQTQQGKSIFELKYPAITNLLRLINRKQLSYRAQHPDIDLLLVRFYDYVPRAETIPAIIQQREQYALQTL